MSRRFSDDTSVSALGDTGVGGQVFGARMDRGWWIERGPNGGYVAAVVLRAMTAAVDDPARPARSLTVHYLRPPAEGEVRIEVTVERTGRTLSNVTARLHQDGRLLATALAAFAQGRDGVTFADAAMPTVPGPDEARALPDPPFVIPIRGRYESRFAIGSLPFSGSAEAVSGGWIRLAPEESSDEHVDQHVLTAFTDAWIPPVFSKVTARMGVPTVDLTVHFRNPSVVVAPGDFCLTRFETTVAADGYLVEDGEIWSPDGVLLAQSRQLAVILSD